MQTYEEMKAKALVDIAIALQNIAKATDQHDKEVMQAARIANRQED